MKIKVGVVEVVYVEHIYSYIAIHLNSVHDAMVVNRHKKPYIITTKCNVTVLNHMKKNLN